MPEMILAATSGAEQIYYVIDPKEPGKDGVVLTDASVFHVPFWSYVTRIRVQPIRTSGFLLDLWDPNGPNSSGWSDVYVSRTEPFPEEVLKRIKPFLVDVPRRKEPEIVDDGLLSFNQKSSPSQVLTKAGRGPLRQEPYDPDARDGDNDGIVQEGTPWERPAATRFLNEVGEQIERGLTSTTRPKGKLVDADGNEVDYTPTYERAETGTIGAGRQIGQLDRQPKLEQPRPEQPATAEPGKKPVDQPAKPKAGTPLADHGAGSLKEQGLRSVRQTAAPQPPPKPKPPATETPAAPVRIDPEIVDRANIPNTLSAEEIRKKNDRILEEIRQLGGEFGSAHPGMEKRKLASDGDPIKQFGTLVTTEERTARRREVMKQTLAGLRVYLETGDAERAKEVGNWDEGIWTDTRDNMVFYAGTSLSDYAKMDPAIKELILNSTEDELVEMIEESLLAFAKGYRDGDIGMAVPSSRILPLLDDGEYKVAAVIEEEIARGDLDSSARSIAAGADVRVLYEETIGISSEAPANLRPASAYISHPEIEDVGRVDMYGDVRIVMKPEVKERVAIVRGDPLNEKSHAVKLDTDNDDALVNAFLNYQYEGEGKGERVVARMISALEARQSGDNSKMMKLTKYDNEYAEVYIPGSIEMGEVSKIDLRYATMDHAIPEDERTEILEALNIPQLLKDAGASDEVVEEVRQHIPKVIEESKGYPFYYNTGDGIRGLVGIEVLKRVKEKAATRGIMEVEASNRIGDNFNLDWLAMTEAEQVANRVQQIIEDSLRRIENASRVIDDW